MYSVGMALCERKCSALISSLTAKQKSGINLLGQIFHSDLVVLHTQLSVLLGAPKFTVISYLFSTLKAGVQNLGGKASKIESRAEVWI